MNISYKLSQSSLADEIVIIDKNEDLVRGQVLDLVHGQPFMPSVVSGAGAGKIINSPLPEEEMQALHRSAAILKEAIVSISG